MQDTHGDPNFRVNKVQCAPENYVDSIVDTVRCYPRDWVANDFNLTTSHLRCTMIKPSFT